MLLLLNLLQNKLKIWLKNQNSGLQRTSCNPEYVHWLMLAFFLQHICIGQFAFGHFSFGVEKCEGIVTQQVRLFAVG